LRRRAPLEWHTATVNSLLPPTWCGYG